MTALSPSHGTLYRFYVRRRGNSTPVRYHGKFVRAEGDMLVFLNADQDYTGAIRVHADRIDGEMVAMDDDDLTTDDA